MADRLLVLLQAGCDASKLDSGGHSPSDYALRDPNVWFQWCLAVEASGVTSMDDVLQVDDAQSVTGGKVETDVEMVEDSELEWESCSSDSGSNEIIEINSKGRRIEGGECSQHDPPSCFTPSHLFLSFHGLWPWSCDPICSDCGLRCPLDDVSRRKRNAWGMFQLLKEEHDISV